MNIGPSDWIPFAEGHLDCRVCGSSILVVVMSRIVGDPDDSHLELAPDLSEVWAHWWTHGATVGDAAQEGT